MASSDGKVVSTRWELKDFKSEWRKNKNKDIFGGYLPFGSSRFELFYNPVDLWENDTFGIILKELIGKRPLKVNLEVWLENKEKQKFQESAQKHTFSKEGDRCEFNLNLSDVDHSPLSNIFSNYESLFICCKITELNYQTAIPITDSTQQFHQDNWSMYEQGVHDAVIKVGETEFKILKTFFMSHSEVFKQMFSLNFKERETSIVEVKDISERAMKRFVKWMYTCQIDDQDSIEDLFKIADKYQVNLLKINCAEIMSKSLDNSNAFCRLILAVAYNDNQLKDAALEYINKMPKNEAMIYLLSSEWSEFVQKKSVVADEVKKAIFEKLDK